MTGGLLSGSEVLTAFFSSFQLFSHEAYQRVLFCFWVHGCHLSSLMLLLFAQC